MMNVARKSAIFSFLGWIAIAAIGSYFVWPLNKHVRLGIDLIGGFYITLKVDTAAAVKNELNDKANEIIRCLKKDNIADLGSKKVDGSIASLTCSTAQQAQEVMSYIRSKAFVVKASSQDLIIELSLPESEVNRIKNWAVESNVEVLRKRLDKTGVSEVAISRQGNENIVIELPNVDDPARAKEMIGKAAQLEFRLVHSRGTTEDDLLDKFDGIVPDGMELFHGNNSGSYLLHEDVLVTGKMLKNASPMVGGETGTQPVVHFELTPEGGELFNELTGNNVGKSLAVVLDGKVLTAPNISCAIRNSGTITGGFSWQEAQDLATMLKTGAFVAPVTFEEERRIGPSLGMESIRQGVTSCLIALVALFLFAITFYKMSGFLAFITLLYNLLFVIFSMAWIKATLTLPGIAGMVLTVGMAIDCSILIYEKMREAIASGINFKRAIDVGFSDAMSVILDANITTLLSGIVLYYFGTGPVQGFAITMILGIASTLITGLFFLKSLFRFALAVSNKDSLSV